MPTLDSIPSLASMDSRDVAACTGDCNCPNEYTGSDYCCLVSEARAIEGTASVSFHTAGDMDSDNPATTGWYVWVSGRIVNGPFSTREDAEDTTAKYGWDDGCFEA